MNKIVFSFFILFCCIPSAFAQKMLSENGKISVITCAPYDGEVYTVFGHAAFRVEDPEQNLDIVFNYGMFDDSAPYFIYRFAKGETDYKLGINEYLSYIVEYQMRGSDVTEQVLNLSHDEKNRLWMALLLNSRPENRTYRYNFFFDNCATRLPAMIEKYVDGKVIYNDPPHQLSFRKMVHDCTRNHKWLTFGIDLALGSPADRLATPHEMMFLPNYLKDALEKATLSGKTGDERPLIVKTTLIKAVEPDKEEIDLLDDVFTPLVCGWILFFIVLFLTCREKKKRKYYRIIDIVLFTIAGVAGIVMFYLCFVSEHPTLWPNWSIIWLHPFHLVGVILFSVKKANKAAYYYHFINFAALTLFLLGWYFIPQELNVAFIPLIATLGLRSASRLINKKVVE